MRIFRFSLSFWLSAAMVPLFAIQTARATVIWTADLLTA